MGQRLTPEFMSLFCEKNSDGTKNLRLKGNELFYRVKVRVGDGDMLKIVSFLDHNPCIVKVEMPYNDIGDKGFLVFVNNFLGFPNNIRHLNLTGNNITAKSVARLCAVWPTLKLRTLRLTANPLGSDGGMHLESLLKNVPTLEHLDVGDTHQTVASIPVFCACLRENIPLKTLDVSNVIPMSDMYQTQPTNVADHIGEMIKMNSTLTEVHLQKCQLDGHDMELLLKGLIWNKTLLMLDLGFNRISNFGAELLGNYLKTKPCLIGLNISGNAIGEFGARALSFGLPFSKIRLLDISLNNITDQGMCELLLTIKKPYRLRVFYLWGNELGKNALTILHRQTVAGVYIPETIDFKIYYADDRLQAAQCPVNEYKSRYYCQLTHSEVQELRIKRNKVISYFCDHKAKMRINYYDRIEGVAECLPDLSYEPHDLDWEIEWQKCLEKELESFNYTEAMESNNSSTDSYGIQNVKIIDF